MISYFRGTPIDSLLVRQLNEPAARYSFVCNSMLTSEPMISYFRGTPIDSQLVRQLNEPTARYS